MKVKILQIGNSLGIIIPHIYLQAFGWEKDMELPLKVNLSKKRIVLGDDSK